MFRRNLRLLTIITATAMLMAPIRTNSSDISATITHKANIVNKVDKLKTMRAARNMKTIVSNEPYDYIFEYDFEDTKGDLVEKPVVKEIDYGMSDKDIELIALVTMAEAEGESEYGKRLVIDTILNRMNSEYFPDTASGVVYQPHQFTSMWNGRVNRCHVKDEICQLVKDEILSRTNKDVIFFTAGEYGNYGKPIFSIGNHYFSSY